MENGEKMAKTKSKKKKKTINKKGKWQTSQIEREIDKQNTHTLRETER